MPFSLANFSVSLPLILFLLRHYSKHFYHVRKHPSSYITDIEFAEPTACHMPSHRKGRVIILMMGAFCDPV